MMRNESIVCRMSPKRRGVILRLAVLVVLAGGFAVVWMSPLREHLTREEIRGFVDGARATWYAPLLLVVLYAIGCVFAIPASLFIVVAGAIWGAAAGGTLAMAGGMLGAGASFVAGRFLGVLLPAWCRRGADTRLRDAGFRSMLVLRLLPVFPFAVLNYGAGIARVPASIFFWSTFLGLIPSNYVFAWSADEIFRGTLGGEGVLLRLFAVAAVCIASIAVPAIVARTSQHARPH